MSEELKTELAKVEAPVINIDDLMPKGVEKELPPVPKKRGRPRKHDYLDQQDWEVVAGMLAVHATQEEISAYFSMSVDSLYREIKRVGINWTKFRDECQATAKLSLRRRQWRSAMNGNNTMMIWLGKQLLGQHEKVTTEVSGPGGRPIQHATLVASLSESQVIEALAALEASVIPVTPLLPVCEEQPEEEV